MAQVWTSPIVSSPLLDGQLKGQLCMLLISVMLLSACFCLAPSPTKKYFRPGDIRALVHEENLIGLKPKTGETWLQVGTSFTFVITFVTAAVTYMQLVQAKHEVFWYSLFSNSGWIVFLAISNSFVEEVIFRLSFIVVLDGMMSPRSIWAVSSLVFGGLHYFGMPGGVAGVLMAAFLAFLLSKSITETRGLFWAWFIHFLQDFVIFTALFIS